MNNLEILQVAQHCISQIPDETCCLCSCSVSDFSACLYFPHQLALYFQSHVPVQLLSDGSGLGAAGEKSTAENHGACIARFHS